jgi:hypothetical protein
MDKIPAYKFCEDLFQGSDTCPIQILEGKYKNIIFKYGKISVKETEDQNLSVTMDITMITAPEDFDQEEEEFTNIAGNIFVDIFEKNEVTTKEPVDLEDDAHQD